MQKTYIMQLGTGADNIHKSVYMTKCCLLVNNLTCAIGESNTDNV